MISKTTPEFWERYRALPREIQKLADRCYPIWLANPQHPSIRFKRLHGTLYSIRVGGHYRAVGHLKGDQMRWIWIGTHEEYNHIQGNGMADESGIVFWTNGTGSVFGGRTN